MEITRKVVTEDGYELALYIKGNPEKPAVVFLHGGPGGAISEQVFDYFNLEKWYVIAFDQRGCGQSKPFASLDNNTVEHTLSDMELIRKVLGIDSWHVFGGSYGTTVALRYAQVNPDRVKHLILRGVFLGRKKDIDWLYQEGASYFYPEEHEAFKTFIPENKRHNLVEAYYEIFQGDNETLKRQAAKRWATWEMSIVHLVPEPKGLADIIQDSDISLALLECHFFANAMFWDNDNLILDNIEIIKSIPTSIVHGRYDVDCLPSAAFELAQQLNNSTLYFAQTSGHSGFEPETKEKLTQIMASLEQ